jgi:hypothetical protein
MQGRRDQLRRGDSGDCDAGIDKLSFSIVHDIAMVRQAVQEFGAAPEALVRLGRRTGCRRSSGRRDGERDVTATRE